MNLNPSSFRYTFGGLDNADGVGLSNHESEIWFTDLRIAFPDDGFAIAAVERSDSEISPTCTATESDIRINTKYRLSRAPVGTNKIQYNLLAKTELFEYGGSNENLTSTVMHEMGHSAGLEHEGDEMNLMGGDNLIVVNGSAIRPYIGEDSAGGLLAIYGASATPNEDLSVSHWWRDAQKADGGGSFYSVHHRTKIFDAPSGGAELPKECPYSKPDANGPPISACPEPVYKVNKGQTVYLELTYENAGTTTPLMATVNYYLSLDSYIDLAAANILLKTSSLSFKRDNDPSTFRTALVIPNTAAVISGWRYWLGCIVDPLDVIAEKFEGNNATYVEIKIN
ncbi:MAG: hypothetical protein PHH59_13010 [Methylovulum sp.]|uniref:hypothetical protein n=1 Tax=Methylovulum sp. TaxID=1916980 RepID=UPI0026192953|nr:hypothetical protein [Methylovulum sp.]MDD2724928.1 hypothetical protein [Methylovulum sp.]MDD5124298.1 hypothetical protein [Methylovulum sp.]